MKRSSSISTLQEKRTKELWNKNVVPIIAGGLELTKRVVKNGNLKMDRDHSDNSIIEKRILMSLLEF